MKHTRITTKFSAMSDSQLQEHSLAVVAAMKSSTHFPEVQPILDTVTGSISAYSDALSLAKSRDKVKVALKNEMRSALDFNLRKLAHYCSYVGVGNRSVLASSGFTLTPETVSTRYLSVPENFTVQPGNNSGEARLSVRRMEGAQAYLFHYSLAPATDETWQHVSSSQSSYLLTNLEPLKPYSFKISVIGRKGQAISTEIITKALV